MTRKRGFRKPIVAASLTGEAAQTLLAEAARIAERYDLAIMSTKGMSVTASRTPTTTHEVRHRCVSAMPSAARRMRSHPATLHRNLYALTPNSPWVGRVPMGLNEKRPSARGGLGRSSFCNDDAELGDEPSTPAPQRAEEGELNARQT